MVSGKSYLAYRKFCLGFVAAMLVLTASLCAFGQTSKVEQSFNRGHLDEVRKLAFSTEDGNAYAYRAKLSLLDGDLAAAKKFAAIAQEKSVIPNDVAFAGAVMAHVLDAAGDTVESEKILRNILIDNPNAHLARYQLGELLIRKGSRAEGEVILNVFGTFFNNDILKTSYDLTLLARSMSKLGQYKDANYAMERAIEKDPRNVIALTLWGELLLTKYNTADAEVTYKEAFTLAPNNPSVLVGFAKTELMLSNDYAKIREHLATAEKGFPNFPPLKLIRAEVAIADGDYAQARQFAKDVLKIFPTHLEALTFIAVCDYLIDDREAFEASVKRVLKLSPKYGRVFTETARFSERVHRYGEAIKLNERALKLDPGSSTALLGIGIGLSRTGKEPDAIQFLKDAFDADPYNVRAFNMLEMYDNEIKEYGFLDHGRFKLRAHKKEFDALNIIVPPVVKEAMATFDKSYGFKPDPYLGVEIFPNPRTFSVRSVGLPNISPHGVCFGKVVVMRSPSEGNFNWRQVLWHELAHVYHIQLANNRVPRWFTEGLAEYETNIKDPSWIRHHDRQLSTALNHKELRGVLDLNKGFTHARSFEEILRSYHQASLVIHFIAESHGYDKLPTMLRAWGASKSTDQVLSDVLSLTPEQFDNKFESWLSRRYLNFKRQFAVDLAGLETITELDENIRSSPNDPTSWAKLAVAKIRKGDKRGADAAIERAISLDEKDPVVSAIAAYYYYRQGRMKDAYAAGMRLLDANVDGYEMRFILGSAAVKLDKIDDARVHFQAATTLWDGGVEAWQGLARIAKIQKRTKLQEKAIRRVFLLDQNDPSNARRYAEFMLEIGDLEAAQDGVSRWFDINPLDSRPYAIGMKIAAKQKKPKLVEDTLNKWVSVRPSDEKRAVLTAIESFNNIGNRVQTEKYVARARALKVSKRKIEKALTPPKKK